MVNLTQANNTTGTQTWNVARDKGRFSRTGSIGPGAGGNGSGTDLHAITEGEIAATDASLPQEGERHLAEEPFQGGE
ncbi:MAG: hypothetical protein ACYTA3_09510 [Planctomycetota bacterium]|jgi:hypothetical protein